MARMFILWHLIVYRLKTNPIACTASFKVDLDAVEPIILTNSSDLIAFVLSEDVQSFCLQFSNLWKHLSIEELSVSTLVCIHGLSSVLRPLGGYVCARVDMEKQWYFMTSFWSQFQLSRMRETASVRDVQAMKKASQLTTSTFHSLSMQKYYQDK